MKKLALAAAVLACAAVLVGSPAQSQPMLGGAGGSGWGPGMMMGPGMMGHAGGAGGNASNIGMLCSPAAAGLAEWRIERIQRLVEPTEAQKAALDNLKATSAKAAEQMAAACPREFPAGASARMELMERRMETMLAGLKTVRPAFDAFYAALSDEQKARLDRAGPRCWGWRNWGPRNPQ